MASPRGSSVFPAGIHHKTAFMDDSPVSTRGGGGTAGQRVLNARLTSWRPDLVANVDAGTMRC